MAISDKLTYLNTTKTKIREGLNSLGADLDTEDTFRSYADAIEGIYEDYPKITGEGESLSLDNTKQASMQIDYKGNTSQTGTPTPSSPIPINVVSGDNEINICGKNLFDKDNANYIDAYINVSTMTFALSSTVKTYYISCKPNTTYTISKTLTAQFRVGTSASTPVVNGTLLQAWNDNSATQYTITTDSQAKYLCICVRNSSNDTKTEEEVLASVQIVKGSTAPNEYEPYIGNSYPLYLGVENLIDLSTITYNTNSNKVSISISGDTITQTNAASYARGTYYLTNLQIGKSYTFSSDFTNPNSCTLRLDIYNSTDSGTVIVQSPMTTETSGNINVTFTATETTHALRIYTNATGTANTYSVVFNEVHLVEGNNHISDNPIELCKIGTYQDYIYKDNGIWYLHKEIGKVVLDGSESNWLEQTTNTTGKYRFRVYDTSYNVLTPSSNSVSFGGFSNYFKAIPTSGGSGTYNCVQGVSIDTSKNISFYSNDINTLIDFKTWLASNNVTLYYTYATSTNTEITDTTLLEQLEALKLATSYESQTNISQVNNDLPFNLDVKALRGE